MKKYFISLIILSTLLAPIAFAFAVTDPAGKVGSGEVKLIPPIANATDPNMIIGIVIKAILGVVGSLALLMFVFGGFTWMLAAGNNERVQKGKDIIIWATLGLVVIFSSYALINLIFDGLGIVSTK